MVINTRKIVVLLSVLMLMVQLFGVPVFGGSILSAAERIVSPGVAVGLSATLFLSPDGKVKASGNTSYGETGVGSTATAKEIPGLSNVKQVALKGRASFALMEDGTVKSWGTGAELGAASTSYRSSPTVIANLYNVQQIGAGSGFAAALLKDGTVKVWGANSSGQLGNGTTTASATPVLVSGLTNVKKISVGGSHMLALLKDGTVKAWGLNSLGQLGLGNTENRLAPVTVPGLSGVKDISAGTFHSLAIMSDGKVKAWGANNYGELGNGTTTYASTPVDVSSLSNVVQISAGNGMSMAVVSNGTPYVWGNGSNYQLGLGNTSNQRSPVPLSSISDAAFVVAGQVNSFIIMNDYSVKASGENANYHFGNGGSSTLTQYADITGLKVMSVPIDITLLDPLGVEVISGHSSDSSFLLDKGAVKAWGDNSFGQLGLGDTSLRTMPTAIPNLTAVRQISTGQSHTLAVLEDGTVMAWGYNAYGQLGLGNTTNRNVPTLVPGLSGVRQVIAGQHHSLAVLEDGTVMAWGYNTYGQLGLGNTTNRSVPTTVPGLSDVKQLTAGMDYTLALLEDGTVKAWGNNTSGQLGLGDTTSRNTPVSIPSFGGVRQLISGQSHTLALLEDGSVRSWGINGYGQLGHGNTTTRNTPTAVSGLSGVVQLSAGQYYSLAVLGDGTVKTWGYNGNGRLGLGNETNQSAPTVVPGLNNARQISAGSRHGLLLQKDGRAMVWGFNGSGQLGLGETSNGRSTPTGIAGVNSIRQIVAGSNYSIALLENGTLKSWGSNTYGQLGLGNNVDQVTPAEIARLTNVKQVSAGSRHTVALLQDGTVLAWGYNGNGELGLGDTTNRNAPTVIPGLSGVKQISAGQSFTLALMEDGKVKAWGLNSSGQLGQGDTNNRTTPTTVLFLKFVTQVAAGYSHSLVLIDDGTVRSWGSNASGQLGHGDTTNRDLSTIIPTIKGVKQLSAGDSYTVALMQDGTVMAWGYNAYGQLGLGNTTNRTTPVVVPDLSGVKQLSAGRYHALALTADNMVKSWGRNTTGQLGLGDFTSRYVPTTLPSISQVKQLAAGESHSLALTDHEEVKAWGDNVNAALGYKSSRTSPEDVPISALTYQPRLYLSGQEGATAVLTYYVDGETTPRQSKSIRLTAAGQLVTMDAFDTSSLSEGVHTLRVEATDGTQIIQQSVTFTVDNAPTGSEFSATSTVNSITASVKKSSSNLAAKPLRISLGNKSSDWMAFSLEASYTFASLTADQRYPVTFEIKDASGKITKEIRSYYTLAAKPTLKLTATTPNGAAFAITDSNPKHTQYQLIVGNRTVNENGQLVAEPTWITLPDKTIRIQGLTASKSYKVSIKARNQEGIETEESASVQVGTPVKPPAIPQQLTAETTTSTIRLSWMPVADATGYQLERDNSYTVINTGAATSYMYTGYVPDMSFTFRVRAVKYGVYGEWSNPIQAKTLIAPPTVPNNVRAAATSKTVTLSWNPVTLAVAYEVEWDGQIVRAGTQTTWKQIGLQPGSQHTYRVRAVNAGGPGIWSAHVAVMTGTAPPTGIQSLTGEASDRSVSLRWQPIDDASYYELEADGQLFHNGSSFFAELKGLAPGTAHQYRLRAVNEYGVGPWSGMLALTTNKLPTPSGVKEKQEDTSVLLTWVAVPLATGYQVEADGQLREIATPEYSHLGLTPETTHTYRVRAKGAEGVSGWSALITVQTLPLKPAVPAAVNALAGRDYVTLTWNQVSGATAYEVEIDGKIIIDNFNDTKYTDTLLDPFTSHTYRVRSKTDAVEGEWTAPVAIQTLPDRPAPPVNIVVTSSGNIVKLAWDADPSAIGYDLEVNGQLVNNGLNTEYKHRKVAVGSEHRYRVRIRNQAGVGDWSGLIINNNLTARMMKGNTFNLGLTGSNVTDFSRYTLTVTYDPQAMSVADLSTLTGQPELEPGRIEGTDITVTSFRPGQIVFVTDRVVKPGESWTGVINSIKFMAHVTGGSALTYSVIQN